MWRNNLKNKLCKKGLSYKWRQLFYLKYSTAGMYDSNGWKQKAVLSVDIIENFNKGTALRMNK